MLIIRTVIRPSATHGIGLFAAEPVAAGTRMWEFDDRLDRLYSNAEFQAIPEAHVMLMLYGQFTLDGDLLLCGDDARFVNHSETPSMSNMEMFCVAARDIAAGEEITEDYRTFAPGACAAFLDHRDIS